MTRSVFCALVLLLSSPAAAMVPGEVSFQGRLEVGGVPRTGPVDLVFTLFDAETGGSAVWSESHADVPLLDGLYDVLLGSATPIPQEILGGGTLFLEVEADGETLAPRQPIVALPYAIRAAVTDSADAVGGVPSAFYGQIFDHGVFDEVSGPPASDPREGLDDLDGDGLPNFLDADNDGDGLSDGTEIAQGTDMSLLTPRITSRSPPQGPSASATLVRVKGSGFDPGIGVEVDGQGVPLESVTPTQIEFFAGPHAPGTFAVVLTNPNGESGATTFEFEP